MSHVAPKMQHVTFCDTILRFDLCRTKRLDSVCVVTLIPQCARYGSVITWGRGEGETLSIHVVSTQCAGGLSSRAIRVINQFLILKAYKIKESSIMVTKLFTIPFQLPLNLITYSFCFVKKNKVHLLLFKYPPHIIRAVVYIFIC